MVTWREEEEVERLGDIDTVGWYLLLSARLEKQIKMEMMKFKMKSKQWSRNRFQVGIRFKKKQTSRLH